MGIFDRLFGNNKEEETRLKLEQEAKAKLEAEAAKKAEEDKLAKEAELEQAKKEEEERLAKEVEEKQVAEANRLEQETKAKLEAEAAKKAEEDKLAKEAELEQAKKEEEERLAKEVEEKQVAEANRLEQEAKAKLETEAAKKAEEVRLAKEAELEKAKKEEERLAKEAEEKQVAEANKKEQEAKAILEAEAAKKAEEVRLAKEAELEQAKKEEERLVKEAEEKQVAEANKKEQEAKAILEAEAAKKAEEDRLAKEVADKSEVKSEGLFNRFFSKDKKESLDKGLEKTKKSFFNKIARSVAGKSKVDADVLDNLEETLITSDVGVDTTLKIIDKIEARVSRDKVLGVDELNSILREEIASLLEENNSANNIDFDIPKHDEGPHVIMVVGVNGVGKTTTIGKLAHQFKLAGKKVVLGASDTFRAAAVDQLIIWAERVGVPIVHQGMGADPASVAFDTLESAKAQNADVVIIDTAGRLHNKVNLMNELGKIKRVMNKVIENAPHEILLVLDGSTGQNAYEQAKQFAAATDINALAITKLDGTAKGGVVIGISDQMKIPVKYIGVGEGIEDLQPFNGPEFVDSLFSE